MKDIWQFIEREFKNILAFLGILAFALSSVYAIWRLLTTQAKHPSNLYALPAIFVETVTAITIWQMVQMFHHQSRSNQTKQDKTFYRCIMLILGILVVPSLTTSIVANFWEFGGHIPYSEYIFPLLLGLLCPLMCIICAVLGAIPKVVARRAAKVGAKIGTEMGSDTMPLPRVRKAIHKGLPVNKRREQIFALFCKDLNQTTQDLAKRFAVSPQTIRDDLRALDKVGKIVYKAGKVSLRPQAVVAK